MRLAQIGLKTLYLLSSRYLSHLIPYQLPELLPELLLILVTDNLTLVRL